MSAEDAITAFDPGRNIGMAVVTGDGQLISQSVLNREQLLRLRFRPAQTVLVGDGTGSDALLADLRSLGAIPLVVDEDGTTLLARQLYWQNERRSSLLRLLPAGLRPQPAAIDGYAAWALALRWLRSAPGS